MSTEAIQNEVNKKVLDVDLQETQRRIVEHRAMLHKVQGLLERHIEYLGVLKERHAQAMARASIQRKEQP